ncbi:MAG: hypothetical protein CEE42_15115, partial [Promethearchaeota archaeon Loki_b31]
MVRPKLPFSASLAILAIMFASACTGVEDNVPRRGAKMDTDEDIFRMVEDALKAGAAGLSIGRNAFQHKDPTRVIGALSKMVHEGCSVEQAKELGGWAKKMHAQYPKKQPFVELMPTGIPELEKEVQNHKKINIFTSAEVEKISGQPGLFEVSIKQADKVSEVKVGSIVLATGWKPYDPAKLTELNVGKTPHIITNVQMEEKLSSGEPLVTSDGKPVRKIAFIQCAGSRDENHLPYCSSVCCMISLKQALYCRELDPDSQAFIFYKDLRTPGQYEDFYKRVQEDEGTFLTKSEVKSIDTSNGVIVVEATDTLLGDDIKVKVDL